MKIKIVEVGLRDGLQNEKEILSTDQKTTILTELLDIGLRNIEVTSFVNPKWIPQLADAEELSRKIPEFSGASFSALIPNLKGLTRALPYSFNEIAIFVSASESHNKKNLNSDTTKILCDYEDVVIRAKQHNKKVRVYISTVFGCPYEGTVDISNVINIIEYFKRFDVDEFSLGDTIGVAVPKKVKEVLREVSQYFPIHKLAGHFHDTRGTALLNSYVALEEGVRTIDTAFGGFGGCPYALGASGNLATEDFVYLLEQEGINTGINLDSLIRLSAKVGKKLHKNPYSKLVQAYKL